MAIPIAPIAPKVEWKVGMKVHRNNLDRVSSRLEGAVGEIYHANPVMVLWAMPDGSSLRLQYPTPDKHLELVAPPPPTIHILDRGLVLCSSLPLKLVDWPATGHEWVHKRDWLKATCVACCERANSNNQ